MLHLLISTILLLTRPVWHFAQVSIEFASVPHQDIVDMVDVLIDSWFACGRIGGFNTANLQARWDGAVGAVWHGKYVTVL